MSIAAARPGSPTSASSGEYVPVRSVAMAGQSHQHSRRFKVDVWRSLMEVHETVLREIEVELADRHQMSVREFDVLVNIPGSGVRLRELTDRVVLSQSALSRLVERLEGRGWVEREGVADDSRAIHIRLTDRGRKSIRAAARTNAAVVERLFADRIAPEELEALDSTFKRLRRELGVPTGDEHR